MSFERHRQIYQSDGPWAGRETSPALEKPGATLAAAPGAHRLDEFAAGYSLAGCSPAEPASASPARTSVRRYSEEGKRFAVNRNLSRFRLSHAWGSLQSRPRLIVPIDAPQLARPSPREPDDEPPDALGGSSAGLIGGSSISGLNRSYSVGAVCPKTATTVTTPMISSASGERRSIAGGLVNRKTIPIATALQRAIQLAATPRDSRINGQVEYRNRLKPQKPATTRRVESPTTL